MSKKSIHVRNITIGGGAPVSVQSMTNVDPHNKEELLVQIGRLKQAGCDIVRLAVPDAEAAKALAAVRKKTDMPLVADIHFDYRLALAAIDAGADKIRINPGNIGSKEKVREIVRAARDAHIPIRVGVNAGSLEKDILQECGGVSAEGLAKSALKNLALIEDMGFDDLCVSLKSSDVRMNDAAYRLVAQKTDHPIHIGVTEAGNLRYGKLKSAVGIGALLLAGIGDTLRVSLTADPVEEVKFGIALLETAGLRQAPYELISCPTCGRTEIDLENLVLRVDERLRASHYRKGIKVAVMGCVVNGPGEAREADYGVAGGNGRGVIFAHGQVVETVPEDALEERLFAVMDRMESEAG